MKKRFMFVIFVLLLLSCASLVSATTLTNGLVAYWNLELSGTKVADSFHKLYNMTAGGSPTQVTGKHGNGIKFIYSSSQYAEGTPPTGIVYPWCVGGWLKGKRSSAEQTVFYLSNISNINKYYLMQVGTGPYNTKVCWHGNTGSDKMGCGTTAYNDDAWHQVITCYINSTGQKLYVDGKLDRKNTSSVNLAPTTKWGLAKRRQSSSNDTYYNGTLDEWGFWNRTLTDGSCSVGGTCGGEIATLWNAGSGSFYNSGYGDFVGAYFIVSATNKYNSSPILTFNITVPGVGFWSTTNGNITTNITTGTIINLTMRSPGYFPVNQPARNTTNMSPILAWKSNIIFGAHDWWFAKNILNFNVSNAYVTNSTTTGKIIVRANSGALSFTIGAKNEAYSSISVTGVSRSNVTYNTSMSPLMNFTFLREANNSDLKINSTVPQTLALNVVCPNGTSQTSITSAHQKIPINCLFSYMYVYADYGSGNSYLRTLIPTYALENTNFYMLDLRTGKDTASAIVINLNDLTGEYYNGRMRVQKAMSGGVKVVSEQAFDIESAVTFTLLKDNLYVLQIINSNNQSRTLGNLIGESGTYTVTFPSIAFIPNISVDSQAIGWGYTINQSEGWLTVQYRDNNTKTTFLNFTVRNSTNLNQEICELTVSGAPANNASLTCDALVPNGTYYSCLKITHSSLGTLKDCKSFGATTGVHILKPGSSPGIPDSTLAQVKAWFAFGFLVVLMLTFGARHAGIGITCTAFFFFMFMSWGWLPITQALGSILIVMLGVFAFLTFYRQEGIK